MLTSLARSRKRGCGGRIRSASACAWLQPRHWGGKLSGRLTDSPAERGVLARFVTRQSREDAVK